MATTVKKRIRVRGHDLMLFLDAKTIALATSCAVDLVVEIDSSSSKDDGIWTAGEIVSMSWTASTDALMGTVAEGDTVDDKSYEELLDAFLAAKKVQIEVGKLEADDTLEGRPLAGWIKPNTTYGGQAWIKQLSLNGPDNGAATMTINLTGDGPFSKIVTTPEA